MNRREILGVLGAGAASLATLSAGHAGAQADEEEPAHHHDKIHDDCLQACSDCEKVCDETFHHCYTEVAQGKKEHALSMHLLADCGEFCGLSACMIARHSPLMVHACASCAEACAATASEVKKFDSPHMAAAVKALRACEKSCRAMVSSMKGHHSHKAAEGEKTGKARPDDTPDEPKARKEPGRSKPKAEPDVP